MKLGGGDVSFRLGATTPTKVYLGSTEVWSDGPPATAPEAVASVTATTSETTAAAAEISWEAPADGGAPITGYRVYISDNGGMSWSLHAQGVTSPYTLSIPGNGGSVWAVDVRAVNSVGEGPTSLSFASVTLSASTPSPPTNITATALIEADIYVAWDASANDGGSEITGYEVEWSGNASVQSDTTPDTVYLIELGTAEAGNEYQIRVRAQNAVGYSDWSEIVTVTAADVPNAPDFLSASTAESEQGAVSLSVSLPAGVAQGSPLLSYDVEAYSDSGLSTLVASETYTDQTQDGTFASQITGLIGGETHYVRVRLTNAIGTGPWSMTADAQASATAPAQVVNVQLSANHTNDTWDFTWDEPSGRGSAITGYELQEDGNIDFSSPSTQTPFYSDTSFSYTPSTTGQARYFRIRAANSVGNGDWSNTVSGLFAVPPDTPTIDSAIYDGSITTILFTPGSNGGETANFVFNFNGSPVGPNSLDGGIALFYTDLRGQSVTMTATNSAGTSPESSSATVVGVPDAPSNLYVAWNGTNTEATFTAPASDGGSTITGYVYLFDGTPVTPDSESAGFAVFGSNRTGAAAAFAAVNQYGQGPASAVFYVVDDS